MNGDVIFFSSLLQSFLYFPLFLVAISLSWYIPGKVILTRVLKDFSSSFENFVLSLVVGMVLWAYQGFVFGFLHIRFLTYLYLVLFFMLYLKQNTKFLLNMQSFTFKNKLGKVLPFFILFCIGVFHQNQQFFITGFEFTDGIRFFTPTADDAMWYTSLIAQMIRRVPPYEPGLVGVTVYNYHYLSSLVVADLIRIFRLPLLITQFHYIYPLISLLLGLLTYFLGKHLKLSKLGIFLFVYLQYFSSDILYLLTYLSTKIFDFSVGPLEDGSMFLENIPRAFSIIVALTGIIFLTKWFSENRKEFLIIVALLFGSIIGFKVHTGVTILVALFVLTFYFILRKNWKLLPVLVLTTFLSMLIYLPVNNKSGSLTFAPFEIARNFSVQEKFHISNLELARRIYAADNKIFQTIRMDITMLLLFLLFEFGIRTLGFIGVFKLDKRLLVFLYSGVLVSVLFGSLFLQPVAIADIFNFYLVTSFFLSILAICFLDVLLKKKKTYITILILASIFIMTVPRAFHRVSSFSSYLKSTSPSIIRLELDAMKYIKNNTNKNDVLLVFNKGYWDSHYPYVSIFAERDTFLSGQVILSRHGIPYNNRLTIVNSLLTSNDKNYVGEVLKSNKISLLYFYANVSLPNGIQKNSVKNVYKNDYIALYKIN